MKFTKQQEQSYRFATEGGLALLTSPFIFNNVLRAAPGLVYPVLPIYYLADAIGYANQKPEQKGHEGDNFGFTLSNRLMRNMKQFLWNVLPAFFYPGLIQVGGAPAAAILFAIVVIGKAGVESCYESNEINADMMDNEHHKAVIATPYMNI